MQKTETEMIKSRSSLGRENGERKVVPNQVVAKEGH